MGRFESYRIDGEGGVATRVRVVATITRWVDGRFLILFIFDVPSFIVALFGYSGPNTIVSSQSLHISY